MATDPGSPSRSASVVQAHRRSCFGENLQIWMAAAIKFFDRRLELQLVPGLVRFVNPSRFLVLGCFVICLMFMSWTFGILDGPISGNSPLGIYL
ncbi:unnamed protein product [Arabidopsis halleri]